jgi:NAD-binding of NADP-dependent 3-hydroxyisobutyrate dehydrogenase/NAD binding domain of 6-phosphogluconate dehydrogenase
MTHLAMAFVIAHPGVTSAIIGPRTMEQPDDLLAGVDVALTDEILDRIDESVPPGTDVGAPDQFAYLPPALKHPELRRRPAAPPRRRHRRRRGLRPAEVQRCDSRKGALVSGKTRIADNGHPSRGQRVLFVGLGAMGAPMARNLARARSTAARFSLDPATVLGVINASSGRNHATETKFASCVLSGTFDYGFALQLMVKDLSTALDLAAETAIPTPIAALVVDAARAALDSAGAAGADHTFLAEWIAARAGTDLHAVTGRAALAEAGTNERD